MMDPKGVACAFFTWRTTEKLIISCSTVLRHIYSQMIYIFEKNEVSKGFN